MKLSKLNQIISISDNSAHNHRLRFILLVVASMLTLSVSCTKTITDEEVGPNIEEVTTTSGNVHVAFAGGGWRAHTGHSAWTMALLQANKSNCPLQGGNTGNSLCLEEGLANVETISANSGGSWFSTMLMYDPDFINQITDANAFSTWGSTKPSDTNKGWLGKQEGYFAAFKDDCGMFHGADYLACIYELYISPETTSPNWNSLVQNLVYEGYDWSSYGTLGAHTRQPWAKEKTLLMAGTWLASAVILNDNGPVFNDDSSDIDEELFYQVCLSPNTVKTDGDDGSWCVGTNSNQIPRSAESPDVIPVTFSSMPETNVGLIQPSFIARQNATFNLGYTEATEFTDPDPNLNTIVSGGNKTNSIPVINAAAASSAAAGYTASYWVMGESEWDYSYHARNLALGFELQKNSTEINYISNETIDSLSLKTLSTNRVFRVADGGAVDNSAIIQLISNLQLNNKDEQFNIVAFDDIQKNDVVNKTSFPSSDFPSSDISYMFNGALGNEVCVQGKCVYVPNLVVLKQNTKPIKYTWPVTDDNCTPTNDCLYYYIYEVETVENPSFNIKGGSTGVLHVFASHFGCADTAPENYNDFACYNQMLQDIKSTLNNYPKGSTSGNNGYQYLLEAFGLSLKE